MKRWLVRGGVVVVGLLVLGLAWRTFLKPQPRYQDRTVGEWFRDYVAVGSLPGRTVNVRYWKWGRVLVDVQTGRTLPNPPMEALRVLGAKAVPYLIAQLANRDTAFDRVYAKALYRLPLRLRGRLPNPNAKGWRRFYAAEVLSGMGNDGHAAAATLIEMLKRPNGWEPEERVVLKALLSVGFEPDQVVSVATELKRQVRCAEALRTINELSLRNAGVAHLLAEGLWSMDEGLRLQALSILEHCGPAAGPAVPKLMEGLRDQDKEIRYLSARVLTEIGTNAMPALGALREACQDENDLVRNTAINAIGKIAPESAGKPSVQAE